MKRITLEKWFINNGYTGKITSLVIPDDKKLYAYDVDGEKKRIRKLIHIPDQNTGRKFKVEFVDGTHGWRRTFEYIVEEVAAPKLNLDIYDVPKDNEGFNRPPKAFPTTWDEQENEDEQDD